MTDPTFTPSQEMFSDLTHQIAERLKSNQQTIAVAESSTGGLISACLLAVPGASAYFLGGSVVYTLVSRRELIGIRRADVEGIEPLTEQMSARFAAKARQQLDATWGIAELGVAGPTGAPYGHPAGTSVIAVDGPNPRTLTVHTHSDDREKNMWHFTQEALSLLLQALDSA